MDWKPIILIIIATITVLEYIFVYLNPGYGMVMALFMVILIYIAISLPKEAAGTEAVESLALIPLYVLFTSSLPWFFVHQSYLLPAMYTVVLAICVWHVYEKGISMERLGLVKKKWVKYAVVGALIGIPTGSIEYFVLRPEPAFPAFQIAYLLRDFLYMTLFVALGEELLFRSIIQVDLQKTFGNQKGLLLASYIFGIMHLSWRSPTELVFAFLAGYLLGYIYNRTGSLVGPIMLHAINNTVLVGILPYLFR
ncbi:MAG: type II CAAX endopeptidase family protein [Candidatus Hydrothermarchaeaceae archaeon]